MSGDALLLNADSDLSLGGAAADPAAMRRARLLSLHALIGCGPDDVALLRARPSGDYCDYLEALGLGRPRWLELPDVDASKRLLPLGWDARARELARRHERCEPHCALDVVRSVNARSFGAELERRAFDGDVRVATDVEQVDAALRELGPDAVIKLQRSTGGQGNRRVPSGRLDDASRALVERALERDGAVVVEPWRQRLFDVAAVFVVSAGGQVDDLSIHQTTQTRDGGLIGALLGAPTELSDAEGATLERAAGTVAQALARAGYHGAVCLDAFVYRDARGRRRLRPLVEINARRPMSSSVARLRARCFAGAVLLWRFVSRKRLRVPAAERTLDDLGRALGALSYQPDRRRGVIFAAPLAAELDGALVQPSKLAVAIVAEDAASARAAEVEMRRLIGG